MADKFDVILEDNAQLIAAPVKTRTPSPLAGALEGVSNMLDTFISSRKEAQKNKKLAEKDAAEKREQEAAGFLLDGSLSIEKGIDPFSQSGKRVTNSTVRTQSTENSATADYRKLRGATGTNLASAIVQDALDNQEVDEDTVKNLEKFARVSAREVAVTEAAVDQGRLPSVSKDALMDRLLQEARAKYPDVDVKVLASTLEAFGLKNTVFNQIRKEVQDNEGVDEANRNYYSSSLTRGRELAGPAGFAMSEQDLIKLGSADIQQANIIKKAKDEMELNTAAMNLDDKKRENMERENTKALKQITIQSVTAQLAPYLNAINDAIVMSGQPGADPNIEKKLEDIRLHFTQKQSEVIENAILQLAIEDVDEAAKMRTFLQGHIKSQFLDPLETRDNQTANLAKKIKDRLGLEFTQAMPFITMARTAGINVSLLDTLMGQLDNETAGRIADEMKGLARLDLSSALNRDSGMLYVSEIMSVLKGDTRLNQLNYTPEKARKTFATFSGINRNVANEIVRGDFTNADSYMNLGEEFVVAAGALNNQSGEKALVNAMLLVTERGKGESVVNKLIENPSTAEEGRLFGLASRAAAAKVMMGLTVQDKTEGFHSIVWDANTATYKINFNRKAWDKANPGTYASASSLGEMPGDTVVRNKPPAVPDRLSILMNTMNTGISYLSRTTKWDTEAPKGTDKELREWYGRGKMTEDMRKKAAQRKKTKGGSDEILRNLNALDEQLVRGRLDLKAPTRAGSEGVSVNADGTASATGVKGQTITVRPVQQIKEQYADNPNYKTLVSRAEATGMPVDLVVSLVGNIENRSFANKAAAKTRRGHAWGVMQVHDADWDATAQKRYGKKVKDLSPEQNIDMGLWILAQNYKATGNWPDAISMYHSGKRLEDANSHDGNMYTKDYVGLVLQGAGM